MEDQSDRRMLALEVGGDAAASTEVAAAWKKEAEVCDVKLWCDALISR